MYTPLSSHLFYPPPCCISFHLLYSLATRSPLPPVISPSSSLQLRQLNNLFLTPSSPASVEIASSDCAGEGEDSKEDVEAAGGVRRAHPLSKCVFGLPVLLPPLRLIIETARRPPTRSSELPDVDIVVDGGASNPPSWSSGVDDVDSMRPRAVSGLHASASDVQASNTPPPLIPRIFRVRRSFFARSRSYRCFHSSAVTSSLT